MRKPLLLVPFLALSVGCEELEPYMPQVRFDQLEVKDINFERADVDFVFQVENPNPVEISLASFNYALGFEQTPLFSGDDSDGFELEAIGDSELRLPVGFGWTDAWNTVQAVRGEDFVDFQLDGEFGFDTPVGLAELPYAEDGSFPAVRTPKFSFKKVRVTKLNAWDQTADVEIDLGVDNDHGSSLFFENFDYKLKFGDQQVATGLIPLLGEADGATESTQVIPVTVDLVNAGSTVWDALAGGGDLKVGLDATTDVDTPFGLLPLQLDESGNVQVQSP
jgi:LEA14-like dessication related protein